MFSSRSIAASLPAQSRLRATITALALATLPLSAGALLPQPDHIVYGILIVDDVVATADDTDLKVEYRFNGEILATYSMGEDPNASDAFVLRVPMDALGLRTSGTGRAGDTGEVIVARGAQAIDTLAAPLGAPGVAARVNLGDPLDGDGIPGPIDNCPITPNFSQDNQDGDSAGDACDVFPSNPLGTVDTDGDGMGDEFEEFYGFDPTDETDANDDPDGDLRTNREEFEDQTNPLVADGTPMPEADRVPMAPIYLLLLAAALAGFGSRIRRRPGQRARTLETRLETALITR